MNLSFKRREPATVERTISSDSYSILDARLTVLGDIESDGTVRIEGRLEGSVRRADVVILGAEASVQGNVSAREVIVSGSVQGNIEASERAELQPTAVVTGDIQAGAILIHEGGAVRGRLTVRSTDVAAKAAEPRAPRLPSLTPRAMRIAPPAAAAADDAL